jgi:hypothetical protein
LVKIIKETQMINWLKGKKTYFLAAALVAYVAGGYFTGHMDAQTALGLLYGSSVIASLRAGIKNSVRGTDAQVQ